MRLLKGRLGEKVTGFHAPQADQSVATARRENATIHAEHGVLRGAAMGERWQHGQRGGRIHHGGDLSLDDHQPATVGRKCRATRHIGSSQFRPDGSAAGDVEDLAPTDAARDQSPSIGTKDDTH